MNNEFQIHSYSKAELACLYFPDADSHTALNRLTRWIHRCSDLERALAGCHQSKYAKYYSSQAVRLIVEFLGEP